MSGGVFRKVEDLDKGMEHFFTAADESIGTHTSSDGQMAVTKVIDPYAIPSGGLVGWVAGIFRSFLTALSLWPQAGYWGVVGYDWSNTNINLAQSWLDTNGSISYDIQVKMNNTLPYFMTGLGFKLRSNADESDAYGYGVSILRQRQTRCCNAAFGIEYYCSPWGSTSVGSCLETSGAHPINDGIHPALKPLRSYAGSHRIWTNDWGTVRQYARYSEPVIALWQRNGPADSAGDFKLLAYRIIKPEDGLTTGTGSSLMLNPWVTLMARVIEGYELPFTSGRVDGFGRHFKYGDTIMNQTGTKSARIVGTPVMSTDWGASNSSTGVGKMMLTNVTGGGFSSGEQLYIVGGDGSAYATTSEAQAVSKTNYILVYYSSTTTASGDTIQANNTRLGNPVYSTELNANWPPDDWTDRSATNDYFTLVKWQQRTPANTDIEVNSWEFEEGKGGWEEWGDEKLRKVESLGVELVPQTIDNTVWATSGSTWSISPLFYSDKIRKEASLLGYTGTAYLQDSLANYLENGKSYKVSVTVDSITGIYTPRITWSIGSNYSQNANSSDEYSGSFTANSSTWGNFSITGKSGSTTTISRVSVREQLPMADRATNYLNANIPPGTSVTVSITVDSFSGGSGFYYTIGGYTSPTYTTTGTKTITTTSATGDQMIFCCSDPNTRFVISNISVRPAAEMLADTLNTSADTQGYQASYVPAVLGSDFYRAVIKTGALVSPTWSSGATYQTFLDGGGDSIALVTSSHAPNQGATTFYDDFAVQLDMKAGVGFLPPIQQ